MLMMLPPQRRGVLLGAWTCGALGARALSLRPNAPEGAEKALAPPTAATTHAHAASVFILLLHPVALCTPLLRGQVKRTPSDLRPDRNTQQMHFLRQ
jgi:hypothetical protein